MKRAYLVGGMLAVACALAAMPAGAVPLPQSSAPQSLATNVDWHSRCVSWRHECARRWGWGTWRYRRCVVLHGCR